MPRFEISGSLLFLCLALGCGGSESVTSSSAQQESTSYLEGTWATVSMATNGEDLPPEKMRQDMTVTFDGNKMITKRKDKVLDTWTYSIDPSQSPKQLTINTADPGEKERLSLLIYKIEGDTLTTLSGSRSYPTEFTKNTVKGCYLTVRKRVDK